MKWGALEQGFTLIELMVTVAITGIISAIAIRNLQIRGGIAFVNSVMPTTAAACTQADGGFELAFCPLTGNDACFGEAVFDLNNDGDFSASGDPIK